MLEDSVPTLEDSAVNEDGTITLTYSEVLAEVLTGATLEDAYTVEVNGTEVTIEDATVTSGEDTVVLTLDSETSVLVSDTVTVSYDTDADDVDALVEDLSGNEAASFEGLTVTNETEAPELIAALVNGSTLTLTYSEAVEEATTSLATTDFKVLVNGAPISVSDVTVDGSEAVVLTLGTPVPVDATVTVSYTDADDITDATGNAIATLDKQAVLNVTTVTP